MKEFFVGLIVVVAFIGACLAIPAIQLQVMRIYGTELESVKTEIYRENKSYVEGTVRDLRELHVDYVKANDSQKESLRSLILHRANELDWERLPVDVREFLKELRGAI